MNRQETINELYKKVENEAQPEKKKIYTVEIRDFECVHTAV